MTNDERAGFGAQAIEHGQPDHEDIETMVSDTLANIMHYCDSVDVQWAIALGRAARNYGAERVEEEARCHPRP